MFCFPIRAVSHDVTAAILAFQNNETAAVLVYQENPLGVQLFSHVNAFFCSALFMCVCAHNLGKDKGSSSPGTSNGKTKPPNSRSPFGSPSEV